MIWVDEDEEVASGTVPTITLEPLLKPLPLIVSVFAGQLTMALLMTGALWAAIRPGPASAS